MNRERVREVLKSERGSMGKIARALDIHQSGVSMWLAGSPSRRLDAIIPRIAEEIAAGKTVEEAITTAKGQEAA